MGPAGQDPDAFVAAWETWRAERDARLAAPHGFLAVTGLHWLDEEPTRFDDVPGAWSTGAGGPVVELGEGESLRLGDHSIATGRHALGAIAERDGIQAWFDDAVVEVARRGGRDLLRPRHPDNPRRLAFTGTPAYPVDPALVVAAAFAPYDPPVPTTVGSVVDGLEHGYAAVGELRFALGGADHTLVAFPGADEGSLQVLLSDATAGVTTHGAVRALHVPAPTAQGAALLDLNRVGNLPCAWTPYATCPLPPGGNRLPVAVEAGEQAPAAYDGPAWGGQLAGDASDAAAAASRSRTSGRM